MKYNEQEIKMKNTIILFTLVFILGCSASNYKKYTNYGKPKKIKQIGDDLYIIEGDRYRIMTVLKAKKSGKLEEFSKVFSNRKIDTNDIIEAEKGIILIVGTIYKENDNRDIVIVKLNEKGEVILKKTYVTETKNEYGRSIVRSDDEGFIIVGYKNILKINKSLEQEWIKYF